jgi:hypothetical protein
MVYAVYSPSKKHQAGRRRAAIAAMQIVASFFTSAGVVVPAGVCPPGQRPADIGRIAAWLTGLAALAPVEAMQLLAHNTSIVSSKLMADVELQYNAGVRASRCDQLPLLASGELAAKFALHVLTVSSHKEQDTMLPVVTAPAAPRGRFYYIAAGIGSGISEMQQVSVLNHVGCTYSECSVPAGLKGNNRRF